jgi:hypothetical protein
MTVTEVKPPEGEAKDTVEVYAFFEGTVKREKGKIRLPYDGCAIYFGRLKREGNSDVLGFDGYVLENTGFGSVRGEIGKKHIEATLKRELGTEQKGQGLSEYLVELRTEADYIIINKLKINGVKKTCNVKVSDIGISEYREFDIGKPEQKQVVDQLYAFLESDAKDFAEFTERNKAKEAEKPQKVKRKVKKAE